MIGIYKITSPSGKIYIGQSINISKRLKSYKSRHCKKQPKLHHSFEKYGFEAHIIEVVEKCTIDELNDRERYYQDLFDCVEKGLNCSLTSSFDKSGKLCDEHKKKISEACKNPPQERRDKISRGLKGKKRPNDVKLKISESHKGIKHSKETREKIAENSRNISKETRQKYRDSHIGHTHTLEARKKISEGLMGRSHSDEAKLKISMMHGKRVLNKDTGEIYLSISKAAKLTNQNDGWLRKKLRGEALNNTNLILL